MFIQIKDSQPFNANYIVSIGELNCDPGYYRFKINLVNTSIEIAGSIHSDDKLYTGDSYMRGDELSEQYEKTRLLRYQLLKLIEKNQKIVKI